MIFIGMNIEKIIRKVLKEEFIKEESSFLYEDIYGSVENFNFLN